MPLPEPPGDLVDAIKSNHAVAFVGSGLSTAGGAPTWQDLLYLLISAADAHGAGSGHLAAARRLIEQERLVDAATIISDVLPAEAIKDVIQTLTQQPGSYTPSHTTLLSLNLQAIITTSYDRLLESAFQSHNVLSYSWS